MLSFARKTPVQLGGSGPLGTHASFLACWLFALALSSASPSSILPCMEIQTTAFSVPSIEETGFQLLTRNKKE